MVNNAILTFTQFFKARKSSTPNEMYWVEVRVVKVPYFIFVLTTLFRNFPYSTLSMCTTTISLLPIRIRINYYYQGKARWVHTILSALPCFRRICHYFRLIYDNCYIDTDLEIFLLGELENMTFDDATKKSYRISRSWNHESRILLHTVQTSGKKSGWLKEQYKLPDKQPKLT